LTLAEADAELQRLAILKKNHADDQYLTRRNLRDLPEIITRQRHRLASLTADLATVQAHASDAIVIGNRPYHPDEVMTALGKAVNSTPDKVLETRRFPLGVYRGLHFGLVVHPQFASEIYLEGKATRLDTLSREHQGPRAVLNALERIRSSYAGQCDAARRDLALSETQLGDYQARRGVAFQHDGYLTELARLRDELRHALSIVGGDEKAAQRTADTAEAIKALRSANSIEATPQRSDRRAVSAEEPVTARIRRRAAMVGIDPDQGSSADPVEAEATSFADAAVKMAGRREWSERATRRQPLAQIG